MSMNSTTPLTVVLVYGGRCGFARKVTFDLVATASPPDVRLGSALPFS
jgi:hypothetical protein